MLEQLLNTLVKNLSTALPRGGCHDKAGLIALVIDALQVAGYQRDDIAAAAHVPGARTQIDILASRRGELPGLAIGCIYDRTIPSGHNQPRTQKAGDIFGTIANLIEAESVDRRLLVYLTDDEMYRYLTNPANGLDRIFGRTDYQCFGVTKTELARRKKTFTSRMGNWPPSAEMSRKYRQLPALHHLWVFGPQTAGTS